MDLPDKAQNLPASTVHPVTLAGAGALQSGYLQNFVLR